ncbi:MAG: hypothetical protein Kow0025_24810 [Thermodesulfovibrionales bacterium]
MAMTILLFVSLALMQSALMGIDSNMKNVLRDEAVAIAEDKVDEARNVAFASLANATGTVTRDFRSVDDFPFTVTNTVSTVNANNRQVNVTVGWQWKGEPYTHSVSTIVRR